MADSLNFCFPCTRPHWNLSLPNFVIVQGLRMTPPKIFLVRAIKTILGRRQRHKANHDKTLVRTTIVRMTLIRLLADSQSVQAKRLRLYSFKFVLDSTLQLLLALVLSAGATYVCSSCPGPAQYSLHKFNQLQSYSNKFSGQSYKRFKIVIYDFRVNTDQKIVSSKQQVPCALPTSKHKLQSKAIRMVYLGRIKYRPVIKTFAKSKIAPLRAL